MNGGGCKGLPQQLRTEIRSRRRRAQRCQPGAAAARQQPRQRPRQREPEQSAGDHQRGKGCGGQAQPRGQNARAGGCPQAADGAQHPQAAHAVQHDRPARCRRVLPGAAQHHGAVDVAADHGAGQERVQANGLKVPARGVAHAHLGAQPARQRAPAQGRDEVGGNARRQPRQQPADVRLPQLRQHARRVGQGQHRGQQRQPEQAAQQGLVGALHATISGAVRACWACAGAVFDA